MAQPPADVGGGRRAVRRLTGLVASRVVDRVLGAALVFASCNPPQVVRSPGPVQALVVVAVAVAWWASPMVDARPVRTSMRWRTVAARRRTTVLPAAAVVVAAVSGPAVWLAGCVAALLLAYLVVTDPWRRGVTAPPGRSPMAPVAAAAAAAAAVLAAATVPLASSPWARVPACLAVAAAVTCLVLALRGRPGAGG